MTPDEMLAELERLMKADNDREGYYTTEEAAAIMGVNDDTVRKRWKLAKRAGRLAVKQFREENIVGRLTLKTAYRILP